MFGGLIHCVRTLGDQLIYGKKKFMERVYFDEPSSGNENRFCELSLNGNKYGDMGGSYTPTENALFIDCTTNNAYFRLRMRVDSNKNGRIDLMGNITNFLNLTSTASSITNQDLACIGLVNRKLLDKAVLYPDYSTLVATSISSVSDTYTCLTNGFIQFIASFGNNSSGKMYINGNEVYYNTIGGDRSAGERDMSALFPVLEGDVISFSDFSGVNGPELHFYSNKGV